MLNALSHNDFTEPFRLCKSLKYPQAMPCCNQVSSDKRVLLKDIFNLKLPNNLIT